MTFRVLCWLGLHVIPVGWYKIGDGVACLNCLALLEVDRSGASDGFVLRRLNQ